MGLLPLENGPQDHLFRGKLEQLFRLVITHSGKTQMDFAALMGTNRSNVARWILQLERMELITRTILPGTSRTYGIHLTSHGRALALSRCFLAMDGHDGAHGRDGHAGAHSRRATDRVGMDGKRGSDVGLDGADGIDGVDGADGVLEVDGVDGHAGSDGTTPRPRRRAPLPPPRPTTEPRRTHDGHQPAKGHKPAKGRRKR